MIHPPTSGRDDARPKNLSRRADPEKACRPFDIDRDGCILRAGRRRSSSKDCSRLCPSARGAEIYAEVLAVAGGCDGRGYQNGAGGTGLVRSIDSVLRKSGLLPEQIGHINAHGKSTRCDDLVEARAYSRALGDASESVPVHRPQELLWDFRRGRGARRAGCQRLCLSRMASSLSVAELRNPDPLCRLNVIHPRTAASQKPDGTEREPHGDGSKRRGRDSGRIRAPA